MVAHRASGAYLADNGPDGATFGVTSSKVKACVGAGGHAAIAAPAARASCTVLRVGAAAGV